MKTMPTFSRQRIAVATVAIGLIPWLSSCNKGSDADPSVEPTPPSTTVTTPTTVTATGSLTDIVNQSAQLSLLKAALTRAGLAESYKTGSLTLFAPTDEAFQAAGYAKTTLDTLAPAELQRLIQYHVLNTRLSASSLAANTPTSVPTALVTATISLFKMPDGKLFANNARIVQPDIGANNSVMYVIDRVMKIPSQNTVELIRANPELSFFRLAIERIGTSISTVLLSSTDRGITVFAPSNAAFKAAGYLNEDAVRGADVTRLADILRYHILNARAFSPTLQTGELATLQGTAISITVGAQGTTLTGKGNPTATANLTQSDLTCTNGVLHVIDRMLLPTAVSQ